MKISPNYKVSHFIKADKEEDWPLLVKIFSDRLEGRYLEPIELILKGDLKISEFSGFSILALDCVLIETLTQFYKGYEETPRDQVKSSFITFLTEQQKFKNHFVDKKIAEIFYDHFRNGLLHQAQTKGKSLIRIDEEKLVAKVSSKLNEGLIIDREKFHSCLKDEINIYKALLIKGDDKTLRDNFIRKMKYICNIKME